MSRHMTEEDLAIQAQARAFVEEELIPHEIEAELNEGRLPEGVKAAQKARIKEMGLQAFNIEAKLGGAGLSCFQQVLVSEQAGRATNALGWVFDAPASWLPKVATEHQMHTWVLPAIRGERKECYAITEELAGSDVDAIQATVTKDGDSYVLDGVKWHVTSFNHADHVFFQGKLPDGSHALLVSDLDNPGISVVRTPAYMHTYAAHHPIVSFEGVRVPKKNLIGEEGDGMRFAYEWFRYERLMIAARCCGAARRLIDEASAFAQQRNASGKLLSEHQAISFMLADSATELWAAQLMTYRLAQGIDDGMNVKTQHAQCSMTKLYASEMANRVADRAVQIFGGRGYMRENVAERFYRELRVDRIWEGTSEIQRIITADQLFKRGLSAILGEEQQ